jgi:Peptidase A4 family
VKRLLASSVAALLGLSAFLVAASAAAPTVSTAARAPSRAEVAAAHAAFRKFLAAHETADVPHALKVPGAKQPGAGKVRSGTVTDFPTLNWSGFADASSTSTAADFSNVTGSWIMPAVQCPSGAYRNSGAYMVNWVGIDGFSDSTVEQLGSGAQCFEGVLYYYVWYEMYPNATVEEGTTACINDNVNCPRPGDRITASVQVRRSSTAGVNDYTLSLTDHTRPQESFTAPTQTCATDVCADSSAEWIVERPAYAPGGLVQFVPLADYGQTGFTSGSAVANGVSSTTGGFSGGVYSIPMIDDSVSYFLDCPNQRARVGVLPFNANDITENCPTAVPTRSGGFSVTWDTGF